MPQGTSGLPKDKAAITQRDVFKSGSHCLLPPTLQPKNNPSASKQYLDCYLENFGHRVHLTSAQHACPCASAGPEHCCGELASIAEGGLAICRIREPHRPVPAASQSPTMILHISAGTRAGEAPWSWTRRHPEQRGTLLVISSFQQCSRHCVVGWESTRQMGGSISQLHRWQHRRRTSFKSQEERKKQGHPPKLTLPLEQMPADFLHPSHLHFCPLVLLHFVSFHFLSNTFPQLFCFSGCPSSCGCPDTYSDSRRCSLPA